MLTEQSPQKESRSALESFNILDDELIGLLSGKFNVEDYHSDFNFDKIVEPPQKIEKIQHIKLEEIQVIESDFSDIEAEETENKAAEPEFQSLKTEPAPKVENKATEPEFPKFKPEIEKVKISDPEPKPDLSGKTRRIKVTQPERPSKRPQIRNVPESPNDFGHLELDVVSRNHISKEVKLIKSLAEKFSKEDKSSKKDAPTLKKTPEKTVSPKPTNKELKPETKPSPDLTEKPKYTKPKKVKPAPEETGKSFFEIQYEKTEDSALGIPFDAFDLSDFKLEDIMDDAEETDDILNDQDLLNELYGDGTSVEKEYNEAGIMENISAADETETSREAVDVLEKESAPKNPEPKPLGKFSDKFNNKLNAIIEETIGETIENSLNDLLPGIVERIILKKFNK